MTAQKPVLHICTTCRAGQDPAPDDSRPGRDLHDAVAARLASLAEPPVELRGVVCLAACSHGCAAAITASGKWGYLLGGLNTALAGDLLTYGAAYAASGSGAVLPSRRPASLRSVILGRIPSLAAQDPQA
jgi:predicted metal-binding protein